MKVVKFSGKTLEKVYSRLAKRKVRVKKTVDKILQAVSTKGDEALTYYSKKLDKAVLTPRQLKASESETSGAYQNIDPELPNDFKVWKIKLWETPTSFVEVT